MLGLDEPAAKALVELFCGSILAGYRKQCVPEMHIRKGIK
jgi:hypothetical protein